MRYFAFLSLIAFISGLSTASAQEPGVNIPASIRPVTEITHVGDTEAVLLNNDVLEHDLVVHDVVISDASCASCGDAACGKRASHGCGHARWNPRRELYPRYPYTAWPMTYYYFRPYNHQHVHRLQQDALEWGAPAEMPYSRSVFDSVYSELEKAK